MPVTDFSFSSNAWWVEKVESTPHLSRSSRVLALLLSTLLFSSPFRLPMEFRSGDGMAMSQAWFCCHWTIFVLRWLLFFARIFRPQPRFILLAEADRISTFLILQWGLRAFMYNYPSFYVQTHLQCLLPKSIFVSSDHRNQFQSKLQYCKNTKPNLDSVSPVKQKVTDDCLEFLNKLKWT